VRVSLSDIASLSLPDTTIDSIEEVPAGPFSVVPPGSLVPEEVQLPAH
jgi:hypothetical protein